MKTALITTTINVPSVLALYRKLDPSVRIFVAFDIKTDLAAYEFCRDLGNVEIIPPDQHGDLPWAPYNSIQRRNVALLEALRWGADVIVSVDDDNISLDDRYFYFFKRLFSQRVNEIIPGGMLSPWRGAKAFSDSGWFDVGTLLDPVAPHRGFPVDQISGGHFYPVTDAKVGVAAGICLGDPDISAVTRIANRPTVHRVSELLRAGIVVDPNTWTVFNSQNSAVIRELAPAWMMVPGVSRYDDIIASLIVQRVARERDYHIHFGQPLVYQQRNRHDLVKDLVGELWGMQNLTKVATFLDSFKFAGTQSVMEMLRDIWGCTAVKEALPEDSISAGRSWLDVVERAL